MFQVTEEAELHALLKALLAAKFHPDPESLEIPGSPLVARLCERAVQAVATWLKTHGKNDRAERTLAWFRIGTADHPVLKIVRKRIEECEHDQGGMWKNWTDEQRLEYVRILLSPYTCDDRMIRELAASGGLAEANLQPEHVPAAETAIESDDAWQDLIRSRFPDWGTEAAINRWNSNRPQILLGQIFHGDVIARAPFGIWLDIGVSHPALYLLPDLVRLHGGRPGFQFPDVGELISGQVVALGDRAVITISGVTDALGNSDQA